MEKEAEESKTAKAEQTKRKIVDAALELFAERGFDRTTMRAIAQSAGVSTGNAYYYFSSKEELIQGYYEGLLEQFIDKSSSILDRERDFVPRLTKVLHAWVDNAKPYHEFAGGFFRYAADPKGSMSPFSPESKPVRDKSISLMKQVIEGSHKLKMGDEVRERLPELLWLYQMGVVLYWVYDNSPDQRNTRRIIDKTVPLIDKLLAASRLPVLRSSAKSMIELMDDLTSKR